MRGLKDKVAVVTGGGQGIGARSTLRLAEEGCKVAIFDLKPDAAKETEALAGPKASVTSYELDVGDYAAVDSGGRQGRGAISARSGRSSTTPAGTALRPSSPQTRRCGTRSSTSISTGRSTPITSLRR